MTWSLGEFSDMIERHSADRRREQDEETKLMLATLATTLQEIDTMDDSRILDYYLFAVGQSGCTMTKPRKQIAIWRLVRRHTRLEILSRMLDPDLGNLSEMFLGRKSR